MVTADDISPLRCNINYYLFDKGEKNVSNLSIEKKREISATTKTEWNVHINPDFIQK